MSNSRLTSVVAAAFLLCFVVAQSHVVAGETSGAIDVGVARVGEAAPDFALAGVASIDRTLSEFRGKYVVLEWVNFECPAASQHYDSEEMQAVQTALAAKGVIWFSVCSAAPGSEGYLSGDSLRLRLAKEKSRAADYLLDEDGSVARLYDVEMVPALFMIDPDGRLFYAGSLLGNIEQGDSDGNSAKGDLTRVLEAHKAGEPVSCAATTAYGCSIEENKVIGASSSGKVKTD